MVFLGMLIKYQNQAPLTSSFFKLSGQLTVADIVMLVFANLLFTFPIYGLFPATFFWHYRNTWLRKVPIICVWYLSHAQAIGVIALTLNRFTAVWKPSQHRASVSLCS